MNCPARTEVTDGVCGSSEGTERTGRFHLGLGKGTGTQRWLLATARTEQRNPRWQEEFPNSRIREREATKLRGEEEEPGRLWLLRGDPGLGFTVTFSSQSSIHPFIPSFIYSLACLWMPSLAVTPRSPELPPRPGLQRGSADGGKRKEPGAN